MAAAPGGSDIDMFERIESSPEIPETTPYERLIRRLGETFVVRDVMVQLPYIEFVKPGDEERAQEIVDQMRYSVVPISDDGKTFNSVFCTEHEPNNPRRITTARPTWISDHIPDTTSLGEAFFLFDSREWYFTLRDNHVSGLITYWAFNSREFRVQLYAGLSRVEELSRDVLAKDGCGVSSEEGLNLTPESLAKTKARMKQSWAENGGNRFVDELDYHQVNTALAKHLPWRKFVTSSIGGLISNSEYGKLYNFTTLRDAVMHGRILFPTYREFREHNFRIARIGKLIALLDNYLSRT
jgi:hypothetical protein